MKADEDITKLVLRDYPSPIQERHSSSYGRMVNFKHYATEISNAVAFADNNERANRLLINIDKQIMLLNTAKQMLNEKQQKNEQSKG